MSVVVPNTLPNLCKELDFLVMGGLVGFPTGSHGLCTRFVILVLMS